MTERLSTAINSGFNFHLQKVLCLLNCFLARPIELPGFPETWTQLSVGHGEASALIPCDGPAVLD